MLTGGRFANGAITAAFVRLVQEEMTMGSQAGTKNAGSATSQGFNALTVVTDVIGKIWALPNTIIGLAAEAILSPIAIANGGGFQLGNNAIQLVGLPFGEKSAITIGNTQLFFGGIGPGTYNAYDDPNVQFGPHEQFHTYQFQLWGPFFFPLYLLSGHPFTLGNPFETAAQNYGRSHSVPLGGW